MCPRSGNIVYKSPVVSLGNVKIDRGVAAPI